MHLLAEADLRREHWSLLEALLYESDHGLAAGAGRIALRIAPEGVYARAVQRLFEALEFADWFAKGEIEETLCEQFAKIGNEVRTEVARRKRSPQSHLDAALPVLLAVERRVRKENTRKSGL